jgi:IS1 family transposase
MNAKSRQVIAFHVGDRSRRSAKRLWAKIPQAYRRQATFYTDQYVAYKGVRWCFNLVAVVDCRFRPRVQIHSD